MKIRPVEERLKTVAAIAPAASAAAIPLGGSRPVSRCEQGEARQQEQRRRPEHDSHPPAKAHSARG
jgi:hypothetical protein